MCYLPWSTLRNFQIILKKKCMKVAALHSKCIARVTCLWSKELFSLLFGVFLLHFQVSVVYFVTIAVYQSVLSSLSF